MNWDWLKQRGPYHPFTFRSAAAFGDATAVRVSLFQAVFALAAASAIVWFANAAWCPVIARAIRELPEQGEIRAGELQLPGREPRVLAESRLLSISYDPAHSGLARVPSHVQVELGQTKALMISLFGAAVMPYPPDRIVAFNRVALEPWWGAWRPPLLWMLFGAAMTALLLIWWVLALLYSVPLWIAAVFCNRRLSWLGAWKLASAALLPGAALMTVCILLYGSGLFGLIELLVLQCLHLAVGWTYCIGGLLARPGANEPPGNPFGESDQGKKGRRPNDNPFGQSPA